MAGPKKAPSAAIGEPELGDVDADGTNTGAGEPGTTGEVSAEFAAMAEEAGED
jgi:hypothetical protein